MGHEYNQLNQSLYLRITEEEKLKKLFKAIEPELSKCSFISIELKDLSLSYKTFIFIMSILGSVNIRKELVFNNCQLFTKIEKKFSELLNNTLVIDTLSFNNTLLSLEFFEKLSKTSSLSKLTIIHKSDSNNSLLASAKALDAIVQNENIDFILKDCNCEYGSRELIKDKGSTNYRLNIDLRSLEDTTLPIKHLSAKCSLAVKLTSDSTLKDNEIYPLIDKLYDTLRGHVYIYYCDINFCSKRTSPPIIRNKIKEILDRRTELYDLENKIQNKEKEFKDLTDIEQELVRIEEKIFTSEEPFNAKYKGYYTTLFNYRNDNYFKLACITKSSEISPTQQGIISLANLPKEMINMIVARIPFRDSSKKPCNFIGRIVTEPNIGTCILF